MAMSFRHSVLVTTAVIGLSAVAAAAAPPGANDPVAPAPSSNGAQVTPTAPTAPGMTKTAPDGAQANEGTQQSMEARVEQRITDLHEKLQITPAQEPAWKKFAQTMRDNARKMDQTFEQRVDQMQNMNALDNMKSYARVSRQHAEDVQALLPPFQALYSKMSPEQKQTADQVFREDANRGAAAGAQHG
jgi:protein CpxP